MAAYAAKQPPATSFACARPGTSSRHQHMHDHVRAGSRELDSPFLQEDSQTLKHFQCSFVKILFISKMEKLHFSSRETIMLVSNSYSAFHACISEDLVLTTFFITDQINEQRFLYVYFTDLQKQLTLFLAT